MNIFFFSIAFIAFGIVEVWGILRGYDLPTMLVRGLVVYAIVLFLGMLISKVLTWCGVPIEEELEKKTEDAVKKVDLKIGGGEVKKKKSGLSDDVEKIRDVASQDPQKIASVLKEMMGQ